MANFNSRPNNLEYSSRLSPAFSHTTFTNSQTRDVSLKRKYSDIKRRNIKTSVKRGHSPSQFYQRSFLQPPLSCTQEGWRPAPSDRFKRPKSIRHQRTFSDGEHFMPQTNSESKRFYGKARPQGRLPYSRRSRAISTLPTIHMAGPSVSISSPTVRIVHSPKGVYQTSKTCHNIPSDTQYSSPHIFGRYSNSGFRYKNIKRTNRSGFRSFAKPGFHNKLRKICTDSFSCHGISRTSSRLQNYDVLSTVTQGDKNNRTMQVSTSKQNCLAARACQVTGVSRIDTASCMAGSAAFQTSSTLSDSTARSKQGFLRRPRVSPIASKERTSMVDFQYPPGERQFNTPTILRDDHNVGRVKAGLGCCMRSSDNKGQLVLTGTLVSHKRLRAQSSLSCDPSISQTQDKYINKVATRQYNRSLLHQQQRRHPLTRVDGSDNGIVDVVSQQKHLHSSRASARSTELPGGQSIEDMHRLDRLENPTKAHQAIPGRQGHRPLRYEADAPVTTLRQLAPRSESHRSRCIFSKLGNFEGLRLSPVQSNTTNTHQSSERQNHHCPSDPSVARADLVAFTTSTGNQSASSPTFNTRNTEESHRSNNDASNVPTATSSRLACFQRSCSTVGLPEHVTRLLSASVRKSTNKTYDSSWRKWNSWCDRRQIDPISAGLNNVLTFLSEQFKNNLQYRTVNVLRSAISSTHQWVDGKPIGQHPLVIRLLKGISNERPPKPRYTTTWDVSKVTSYLSSLGDNKTLSLKQLSKKLVMLLALISPERSSVLADLDTRYLKKRPDGFAFLLTNPRKTGDPTSESSVSFPSLPEDLSLCPLACLNTYLTATSNFRSPGHHKLFLSFNQPHNEISRTTIARWLCDVIQAAGIDSSVFKAHSTRAASTSSAAKNNLPLADILKMGDWSSPSTFQKFYYKPIIDSSYARTVLNKTIS